MKNVHLVSHIWLTRSLVEGRGDVLLSDGESEERADLVLRAEGCFQLGALRGVCQGGLGGLRCRLQRVLTRYVLGVIRLRGVQEVHAQLFFLARTTLEIQRLRAIQLAQDAGKHAG